jgi:lysophospholipase L1-like esterase
VLGVVVLIAAAIVLAASSSAPARTSPPEAGRWSGVAGDQHVDFTLSRVGAAVVLSDLVVHCAKSFGAADDDAPGHVRHEAVIDSDGRIQERAAPFARDYLDAFAAHYSNHKAIAGQLDASTGTVTVNKFDAGGPEGFTNSSGSCPGSSPVHVRRVGARTLQDGIYEIVGTSADGTFRVYGQGALIEWFANFRTPIGGDPEEPELHCADLPAEASILAWNGIFPSSSGTFSVHANGGLFGQAGLSGRILNDHTVVGLWGALAPYPLVCTGAGALKVSLSHRAAPLVPMVLPGRPGTPPEHRRPPHPRPQRKRIRYVALGDSYSSGEGVAPYEPGTDTSRDRCHRSTRAYPRLLTLPGARLTRDFYACTGATTANVLKAARFGEPPQLSRPRLRGARLVTISIGGNDAAFSSVVALCSRLVPVPCYRGPAARRIRERIASLRSTLADTYRAIRARAGSRAELVVVDYPNLFPPGNAACGKLKSLYSAPARAFIRRAGGELDDVIAKAAGDAHVRFVDVRKAFAGHEICSAHEWVDFIVRGNGVKPSTGSLHPNAAGQAAYARVVGAALRHLF